MFRLGLDSGSTLRRGRVSSPSLMSAHVAPSPSLGLQFSAAGWHCSVDVTLSDLGGTLPRRGASSFLPCSWSRTLTPLPQQHGKVQGQRAERAGNLDPQKLVETETFCQKGAGSKTASLGRLLGSTMEFLVKIRGWVRTGCLSLVLHRGLGKGSLQFRCRTANFS